VVVKRRPIAVALCLLAALAACSDPDGPHADFVVRVESETFVARVTDPDTILAFRAAVAGQRTGFPIGPLRRGDGGFNAPWAWHLDPDETRLTEAAIEVCDGMPSYVQEHVADFPTYCPWGARIVEERR
jgi:hypothetical protein